MPRSCEDLARDIFNYFKSSSKRICQYKEFQEFCNVSPHKILYPAQTRWLSLSIVVNRILEQWQPLKLFFTSNWYKDRLKSSEDIYKALHDPSIFIYLNFLQWVLPKFVNINKLFQSDRPVLCLLHSKMHELYKDLFYSYMRPCNDPTSIDPSNTSYFLPLNDIYLGAEVLNLLKKPEICKNEAMVEDIRKRCREFLITGCRQIKLRFDFDNPILKSLTQLNPKTVFSSKRPTTLIPFIQMFPRVVKQLNISIQDIDDSWRKIGTINLETEFVDNLKLLNVEEFWIQLKLFERDDEYPFKIISDFILIILALPQSNVSCERMFSKINLIKTKQRNRLQAPSLNGLLNASQCMQETSCHEFEPSIKMYNLMTTSNLYDSANIDKNDDNGDDDFVFANV